MSQNDNTETHIETSNVDLVANCQKLKAVANQFKDEVTFAYKTFTEAQARFATADGEWQKAFLHLATLAGADVKFNETAAAQPAAESK